MNTELSFLQLFLEIQILPHVVVFIYLSGFFRVFYPVDSLRAVLLAVAFIEASIWFMSLKKHSGLSKLCTFI